MLHKVRSRLFIGLFIKSSIRLNASAAHFTGHKVSQLSFYVADIGPGNNASSSNKGYKQLTGHKVSQLSLIRKSHI
ncbi:MAG: hypothetical protein ACKPJF_31135 [Dolichospermum sp.]